MIDILKYSFLGLLVLIFQWMLGELFGIRGITPDFIIVFIIYLALMRGQILAIWIGFVLGLILDSLTSTHLMGLSSLAMASVAYLAGMFHGRIVRIPIFFQYLLHTGFLFLYFLLSVLITYQDADWGIGNTVFLILIPKTLYTLSILILSFMVLRVGND